MVLHFTKNRQFTYLCFCGIAFVFSLTSLIISCVSAFTGGWIQTGPGVYYASFDKNPHYVWVATLFQIGVMITELTAVVLLALFVFLKSDLLKRLSISIAVLSLIISMELLIFVMIWYPPHAMDYMREKEPKRDVVLSSFYWSLFCVVICDAFAITNAVLSFKDYSAFSQYIPEHNIYHTPEYLTGEKKGFYIGLKY